MNAYRLIPKIITRNLFFLWYLKTRPKVTFPLTSRCVFKIASPTQSILRAVCRVFAMRKTSTEWIGATDTAQFTELSANPRIHIVPVQTAYWSKTAA